MIRVYICVCVPLDARAHKGRAYRMLLSLWEYRHGCKAHSGERSVCLCCLCVCGVCVCVL